jgi:type II secretion system protein I
MRRGITLYEVVLALAIFAGAMAAISQAIATGTRAALQARLQSQAMLLCESKMAEVVSGAIPPLSVAESPFEEEGLDGWTWSLIVGDGPRVGLVLVEVEVACRRVGDSVDASFSFSRLVRDPQALAASSNVAAAASTASSTSASGQ